MKLGFFSLLLLGLTLSMSACKSTESRGPDAARTPTGDLVSAPIQAQDSSPSLTPRERIRILRDRAEAAQKSGDNKASIDLVFDALRLFLGEASRFDLEEQKDILSKLSFRAQDAGNLTLGDRIWGMRLAFEHGTAIDTSFIPPAPAAPTGGSGERGGAGKPKEAGAPIPEPKAPGSTEPKGQPPGTNPTTPTEPKSGGTGDKPQDPKLTKGPKANLSDQEEIHMKRGRAEKKVKDLGALKVPPNYPELLDELVNLAELEHAEGDNEAAKQHLDQVQGQLASGDQRLPHVRRLLGEVSLALGELDAALAQFEAILSAANAQESNDDVQAAKVGLAWILKERGDFVRAAELEQQQFEYLSRSLPPDDLTLQRARETLTATRFALGDLAGVELLERQSLEFYSKHPLEKDPRAAVPRENLAATLRQRGDYVGAREIQSVLLDVYSKDAVALRSWRMTQAETMLNQGDFSAADALYRQVIDTYSQTHAQVIDSELVDAREGQGRAQFGMNNLEGARTLLKTALDTRTRDLPEDHFAIQRTRQYLAAVLEKQSDFDGARILRQAVADSYGRTLPADHPEWLRAQERLAAVLQRLCRFADAIEKQKVVVDTLGKLLPSEDPEFAEAARDYIAALRVSGQVDEARTVESKLPNSIAPEAPRRDAGKFAGNTKPVSKLDGMHRSSVLLLKPWPPENTFAKPEFALVATASDPLGMTAIHVRQDGREWNATQIGEAMHSEANGTRLTLNLPLSFPADERETTLTIYAENAHGATSESKSVVVRYQPGRSGP